MVNLTDLTLTGEYCNECGYIHPRPENGICPVAMGNKSTAQKTTTHNKEESNQLILILNNVSEMINNKLADISFDNEYQEKKFYQNIKKCLDSNLQELLNDYRV